MNGKCLLWLGREPSRLELWSPFACRAKLSFTVVPATGEAEESRRFRVTLPLEAPQEEIIAPDDGRSVSFDFEVAAGRSTIHLAAGHEQTAAVPSDNGAVAHLFGITDFSVTMAERAPTYYQPGTRIDFRQASSGTFLRGDWHSPEADWGRWSGREAVVGFRLKRVEALRLRMLGTTWGKQRIVVSLNGHEIKTLTGAGGNDLEMMEIDLPMDALAESNSLKLTLPDAKSPQSAGMGDDPRILGIGIAWLELHPIMGDN